MYAITGITGQIGNVVGNDLLAANERARAVVRNAAKGEAWKKRGCEVALATIEDAASLTAAFQGAEGVFILVPPNFDPSPGFSEAREIGKALHSALAASRPARVIYLSTIGAQASEMNLLTQHSIIENAICDLPMPIAFLRPAWFMENSRWDVVPAREQGVVPSFLQQLDKPVPMVATADIGRAAAGLLREKWEDHRVVELEGPTRVTPNQVAATFTKLLRKPVHMKVVPRDSWETLFRSQGMKNPLPRMRMLDGFNEGWIEFERGDSGSQKGSTSLETVLKTVVEQVSAKPRSTMILYILYNMIVGLAAGVGLLLIARTGTYRRRLAIRRTPPTQTACSEDPSVIRAKGPTDERSFCLQSPFHSKGGSKNPTIAQSR